VSSETRNAAMNCDRNTAQAWELFTVVDAGNGKIALKGNNGSYISSENGSRTMTCNRTAALEWGQFTVSNSNVSKTTLIKEVQIYPNPNKGIFT